MAKKKNRKKGQNRKKKQKGNSINQPLPILSEGEREKMMSDLSNILGEQEFESLDEINAFLQKTLKDGEIPRTNKNDARSQAQDLIYRAWDTRGKERVRLAKKALEIYPDCADAYILLAETSTSLEEARHFFEQGVKAGERALGPECFAEDAGHFWGIIETRPYMRARAELAHCLWLLGKREEAIEHYMDMLRLNPNDNQGIRHILIDYLIAENRDDEARKLWNEYREDGMAVWLYSRALLLFRQEGVTEKSNAALEEALEHNPFVPAYLLGEKRLPRELPQFMGWGDESEAIVYAADASKNWKNSAGALEWLKEMHTGRG